MNNPNRCGAKNRAGNPCQCIAMANGRCRLHGGKSKGPKDPAKGQDHPAYSHGIYSKFFTAEEKQLDIKTGSVENELKMARVQLLRTFEAKEKWELDIQKGEDVAESSMDLVEITRDEGDRVIDGVTHPISGIRKVRRRPDFDRMIQVWTARIESLEKTERELKGSGMGGTPEDIARSILENVDEMDDSVPSPEAIDGVDDVSES